MWGSLSVTSRAALKAIGHGMTWKEWAFGPYPGAGLASRSGGPGLWYWLVTSMRMRMSPRCGWRGTRDRRIRRSTRLSSSAAAAGGTWAAASVDGPASMMRLVSSSAGRSGIDRETDALGLGAAGAGWVACAGFRLATEVGHIQADGRPIPVPGHGYVIVAWRSPPALARPLIVAVGNDGSRLSELGPAAFLDSLTWESIERVLQDDPGA